MRKVFYFDTETTGTDPVVHSIIQIAGNVKEIINLNCQPWEEGEIDPQACEIHGISVEQMKSFPHYKQAHHQLTKTWGQYIDKFNRDDKFIVAGQNIGFDLDMLVNFFYRVGDNYLGSFLNFKKRLDLVPVTRAMMMMGFLDVENVKLETICKYLGVEIKAHDALSDITATRECLEIIRKNLKWGI